MSNQKYIPPKYEGEAFHCPHVGCGVYAKQIWLEEFVAMQMHEYAAHPGQPNYVSAYRPTKEERDGKGRDVYRLCNCCHCNKISFWVNKKLIYPQRNTAPLPNENMSKEIIELYQEAADVARPSPRASAALLRVALERLCNEYGGKGRTLSQKTRHLAKERKLSSEVSDMMELISKTGNKAAHPAEIDFNENPQIAEWLFELINYVAQEMATVPTQRRQAAENLRRILGTAKKTKKK